MRTLVVVVSLLLLLVVAREWTKVRPHDCRIVDGREIVAGGCIPYCPPDPSECG